MTIPRVKDMMTENPVFVEPKASLYEAAAKMQFINCGMLPVGDENEVIGVITDRDIVIRALAASKNPASTTVSNCMTREIFACNENDSLNDAAEKMRAHKVSRLLVKNHKGKVVGILSFGGILRKQAAASDVIHVVERATSRLIA